MKEEIMINEKESIKQMQEGDMSAFEIIVFAYEKAIYNHLRRILIDEADTEDATQETFVKLYLNRKKIDQSIGLKNWLYRVATNTAYDILRKQKRLQEVSINNEEDGGFETNLIEISYTPIEEDILKRDIETALSQLPAHYRTILLLYFREGFSYVEIAEILSLPLNTVKTHIRRAKESLRSHLSHYG